MSIVPITEQIDQTNFVATDVARVYFDTVEEKYFFCDETTEAHGPYSTAEEAKSQLDAYVAELG